MKNSNNKLDTLLILGVVTLLISLAAFYFVNFLFFVMSIANIGFSIYVRDKNVDFQYNNRNLFLIMGFLNLISGKIASGILSFIIYDDFNYNYNYHNSNNKNNNSIPSKGNVIVERPKKEVIDPQVRKIDILLKLGIAMVFIAGFIFATTGWDSLNAIVKVLILTLTSSLFIVLSKFCEKKLKIKSTIYLYWFLGMAFCLLIFFSIGSTSLFGEYFSFNGDGYLLYCSFLSLIVTILSTISYYNFKNKYFLCGVYISILSFIFFICAHFNLTIEKTILVVLPLITVLRLKKYTKDLDTLNYFNDIMILILAFLFLISYNELLITSLNAGLLIINLYMYSLRNKDLSFNYLVPFFTYLLLAPSIYILSKSVSTFALASTFGITFIYFVAMLINEKKMKLGSIITLNVLGILFFLLSFGSIKWIPFIISIFLGFTGLITLLLERVDDNGFEMTLSPIKIIMCSLGLFYLLEIDKFITYALATSLLIYTIVLWFIKNAKLNDVYSIFIAIFTYGVLIAADLEGASIPALMALISTILFYLKSSLSKSKYTIASYIFLLTALVSVPSTIMDKFSDTLMYYDIYPYCFSILCYGVLAFIYRKDNLKANISLIAIALPLLVIADSLSIEWQQNILISVIAYYVTFIVSHLLAKNEDGKKVIQYLGYSISFLLVIFTSNYFVLGYACGLLIASLIGGYMDKKSSALFQVSVGAIIIMIIYQLRAFWELVPAWLYLLVVGIILIIFATYKQLKMIDKNKEENKNENKK